MKFTVQYTPTGGETQYTQVPGGSGFTLAVPEGQMLSDAYGNVLIYNDYGAYVQADDVEMTHDVVCQKGAQAVMQAGGACQVVYTFYGPADYVTSFNNIGSYTGAPDFFGESGNWSYNALGANTSGNTYNIQIGYNKAVEDEGPGVEAGTILGNPVLKYTLGGGYSYRIPKTTEVIVDGSTATSTIYVYIASPTELGLPDIEHIYLAITQIQPRSISVKTIDTDAGTETTHDWAAGVDFTLPAVSTGYAWYWGTGLNGYCIEKVDNATNTIWAEPKFMSGYEYAIIFKNVGSTQNFYVLWQKISSNDEYQLLQPATQLALPTTAAISSTFSEVMACRDVNDRWSTVLERIDLSQTLTQDLEVLINPDEITIKVQNFGPIQSPGSIYFAVTNADSTEELFEIQPNGEKTLTVPYGQQIDATYSSLVVYADAAKTIQCTEGFIETSMFANADVLKQCLPVAVFSIWNGTNGDITVTFEDLPGGGTATHHLDRYNQVALGVDYNTYLNVTFDDFKVYVGSDTTKPPIATFDGADYYMDTNKSELIQYQNVAAIYVSTSGGTGILKYEKGGVQNAVTLTDPTIDPDGNVFITEEVPNAGDALSTVYTSIAMYDDTGNNLVLDLANQTITGIRLIGVAVPVQQP